MFCNLDKNQLWYIFAIKFYQIVLTNNMFLAWRLIIAKSFASTITTTKQIVWTRRPEIGITNSKTIVEETDGTDSTSNVVRGVVIGLSLVALVTLGILGLLWYQRMQRRRYCSQEFLLDSFRYDGYSQLDQPHA